MKKLKSIFAILTAALLLAGCSKGTNAASEEKELLSIGIMPAVDAAPILLAQEEGYFDELGLEVDLQVFNNAQNRQSALQSGEIDGAITDVIALVNNVDNGFPMKITMNTDGMFPFLTNTDYEGKKELKVGMMEVSVTNYLSDRALSDQYDIEKVYINDIPARLEMVGKGTLDMAVIPEPMASQGELNGLRKVVIPTKDEFSPDVLVFTEKALSGKESAIQKFHEAYNKAVEDVNHDNAKAKDLLVEKLGLNEAIKDKILMPQYKTATLPSEEFLKGIMDWNEKTLGKAIGVSYQDLVDERFVK